MKKVQLLTLATVGVLTAGVIGATQISAQTPGDKMFITTGDHMSALIQRLAEKFGVSEDEVKAVFDEEHANREAQMTSRNVERLSQLVTDGKITEDQMTLILEKHKEMRESRESDFESMDGETPEEMKAMMEARHDELKSWAEEHDIDPEYLMGMHRMKVLNGSRTGEKKVFMRRMN